MKNATFLKKVMVGIIVYLCFFTSQVSAQLNSDTYTIGGETPDFNTFTEAVDTLNNYGIAGDGPITFNVRDGSYDEQIEIGYIAGASESSTITFQSESGDSSLVSLIHASPDANNNYVVYLNQSRFVTFKEMQLYNYSTSSYARVVYITGSRNQFLNCQLVGYNTTSTSTNYSIIHAESPPIDSLTISHCLIQDGSYGIYLNGGGTASTYQTITNNEINSYRGVYLNDQNNVTFTGNTVNSECYTCLEMQQCNMKHNISNNHLSIDYNGSANGIVMESCLGNFVNKALVSNNAIVVDGNSSYSCKGISLNPCEYVNVYHNSVYMVEANSWNGALDINGGGNISVLNNVLMHGDQGYAMYVSAGSVISTSDYNNLYSGGNYLAYWGQDVLGLSDLQGVGQDANSVNYYPSFTSNTNLVPLTSWVDNQGSASLLADVPDDINGNPRDGSTPDMGAFEFDALSASTYSGAYTIGATGYFGSYTEAVDSLVLKGVSGPVTLNVQDDSYDERVIIHEIPGASASSRITFQSASADSTAAMLFYSTTNSDDNSTLVFLGTDYVTFRQLSLTNSGTGTYGRVVDLQGNCNELVFENNFFSGSGDSYTNNDRAVMYSHSSLPHNLTIQNNLFTGGSRHISLSGIDAATDVYIEGLTIDNNVFNESDRNVLYYCTNFTITNNLVNEFTYAAFDINQSVNPFVISNNQINSTLSDYQSIRLANVIGASTGVIKNNFISINNSSSIYGIYLTQSQYINVYFNSINIVGNYSTNGAIYLNSNSSLNIKNNIMAVNGNGYAYYVNNSQTNLTSDYNDLYSTGANLVYWAGTTYASLADYQTAQTQDANSVNINPNYISETDLHTNSYWLDGAGTEIGTISTDFDGDSRENPPCIGADEYTSTLVPLSGPYEIGTGAGADYATISDAVSALSENGISGSVTFKIQTGTYNEQFVIPQIFIVNSADSIVFESKSGNAADVIITYDGISPETNYIAKLEGADKITFQNLSFLSADSQYSIAIGLTGNIENINIKHCVFEGRTSSSTVSDDAIIYGGENNPYLNRVVIDSNTFNNGSWAVYLEGYFSTPMENISLTNNIVNSNYKGFYCNQVAAPQIINNHIVFNGENGYGIKLNDSKSMVGLPTRILNNYIYSDYRTNEGGIYLHDSDGVGSQPVLIANNVIQTSTTDAYESYGLRLVNTDNANIYYNSVNISGNYKNDRAFYSSGSSHLNLYNNSFAVRGGLNNTETGIGYAIEVVSGDNISGNNNNFYTPGHYIGKWMGTYCYTLADLQTESGQFSNSINVFPSYTAYDNLTTNSYFLNGSAMVYAGVTTDITGAPRSETEPDIGAYEIVTPSVPLTGAITVGAGETIPTPDSLFKALMAVGIEGPVEVNIQDGTYADNSYFLRDIPGTNALDTVLIQSQSADSSKVILAFTQTATKNFVVYLNGTDYITFKHLTFSSAGSAYSNLIALEGQNNNLNFLNNRFNGVNATNANTSMVSVYSKQDNIIDDIAIKHNLFNYNSYGVGIYGRPGYNNNLVAIDSNYFVNQYYHVYFYEVYSPKARYNMMDEAQSAAVIAQYVFGQPMVVGNWISTNYTNVDAIYFYETDASGVEPGIIANNFVQVKGENGIFINYSNYHNVWFNTVHHSGDNGGRAVYVYNGGNIKLMNNNLTASMNGYALSSSNGSNITESDYNNIYAAGTRYAYWGASVDSLEHLQTISGMDANSLEAEPIFMAEDDLHLLNFDLMEMGTPLAGITTDIDGEMRDAVRPDIGADEIYARPPLADSKVICEGEETPTLTAMGINVKWYTDADLTDLIFSATEYTPPVSEPGVYTYYVTQTISDDESDPTVVTLTINATPVIDEVVTPIDCEGNDYGAINLTVTGDAEPFFYRWSNESTSEDISKLLPGTYSVTVEDIIGCTTTESFEITAPDSIYVSMDVTDASCGENDGGATVLANGGTGLFSYQWTTGDSVPVVDSLSSGIYVVTVTDEIGCSETAIATVNDLGGSTINVDAVNDVSCYGGSDGSIAVTLSGGVTPYEVEWSNGATTQDINNLAAGPYEIVVNDADGCQSVKSVNVNQPDPILIGLGVFDSNCGENNGSATTNVTGGVSPYTYDWSTGSSDPEISGLSLGVYDVVVTDENGCDARKSFAISETGAPVVYVDSIYEGTCGNNDGAVYITAYGGVSNVYDYLWNTGSTEEDLIGVNAGEYSVTVTDTVGCSGAAVAEIEADQPEIPSICIVSVDTATNYNEVVWEKPVTTDIASYNIYRESTQSNVYQWIGSVDYADESIFTDENSNAQQRSYRYKLSAVNTCGVESELSAHHKTMHLTINKGLDGNINLIWDHYEGFEISTYYIYRRTSEEGWVKYDSIGSNYTSYTDFSPPIDSLSYFIEIINPEGCTATKATNRNASRSNTESTTFDKTANTEAEIINFTIPDQVGESGIDFANSTVTVDMPDGTDLSNLTPTIEISEGATISPESGETQDFTTAVVYTVTAEDGSIREWTVTVNAGGLSEEAEIISFSFPNQAEPAVITSAESSVLATMPYGTDVTSLTPAIELSTGASVEPASGTAQDFSTPVTYKVTAEAGNTKDWVVTVETEPESSYTVTFEVSSVDGPVGGAEVVFRDIILYTDVEGLAIFEEQAPGTRIIYTVAKDGFENAEGYINIVDADVYEEVALIAVGISGTKNRGISVYPNPGSGVYYIRFSEYGQPVNYNVFNSIGEKVQQGEFIPVGLADRKTLKLDNQVAGIYYLQLIIENEPISFKLIVK